jgi:hypothetical protein
MPTKDVRRTAGGQDAIRNHIVVGSIRTETGIFGSIRITGRDTLVVFKACLLHQTFHQSPKYEDGRLLWGYGGNRGCQTDHTLRRTRDIHSEDGCRHDSEKSNGEAHGGSVRECSMLFLSQNPTCVDDLRGRIPPFIFTLLGAFAHHGRAF